MDLGQRFIQHQRQSLWHHFTASTESVIFYTERIGTNVAEIQKFPDDNSTKEVIAEFISWFAIRGKKKERKKERKRLNLSKTTAIAIIYLSRKFITQVSDNKCR